MKRLCLLVAFLLPGCATPELAASKPDFVAELIVPNPTGDVHAFRVDIGIMERPEPKARYVLSPIEIGVNGMLPMQQAEKPCGGIIVSNCALAASGRGGMMKLEDPARYSVIVRAYRPGFRTIEVKPDAESRRLHWIPVDLLGQEIAIDVLLGVGQHGWWKPAAMAPRSELACSPMSCATLGDYGLLPGTVLPAHRAVLLFAASEYERLAVVATETEDRHRLEWKAAQMRRYSDELTTDGFYHRQFDANSHKP